MTSRPPQGRRPGSAPQRPASAPKRPDPARTDRVVAVLTPAVQSAGLELEDVELRTVGRRLVLRVLVDSDHGITLDEVAVASRAVSDALDTSVVLGDEPYTLEVSSPGVDRPLTLPRHWRRNVGRLVSLTLTDGREATGRLLSLTDGDSVIEIEVNLKGRISRTTIALADVGKAVVQVEFSRVADADLDETTDDETTDDETTDDETTDDETDIPDDVDDVDDAFHDENEA